MLVYLCGTPIWRPENSVNISYLSNTLTNLCIAFYCILLYCVVLNCIVLLIYCYVDIIQYNAMHKFVGALDNPQIFGTYFGYLGDLLSVLNKQAFT